MDRFREAEEKLYSVPMLRKRLKNYEAARDRAIRRSGPSSIEPIDLSKPSVSSSKLEDNFGAAAKIAGYQQTINDIKEDIEEVTSVVDQLGKEQKRIVELWYFDKMTKEQIARVMGYSGSAAIYRKRKTAVAAFADLFPWLK